MSVQALWYIGNGEVALRCGEGGDGACHVRTRASGISRGTERLILRGAVPQSEWERMRAPRQEGSFPFPVKYGYAAVGQVEAGPEPYLGAQVFCLAPHQTSFRADPGALTIIPEDVPPRRATLAANMETALNAVWDADLTPNSRVAVVGAGLVGCLTAYLARTYAGCNVTLSDTIASRAEIATELGVSFCNAAALADHFDVIFHCSATAAGLETALNSAAFEGLVVEMSWYGSAPVPVPLGAAFHSQRLRLHASQVGHVAPSRRESHDHAARLREAVALLGEPRLDALITDTVRFSDLPARLPSLLAPGAPGIATVITYD